MTAVENASDFGALTAGIGNVFQTEGVGKFPFVRRGSRGSRTGGYFGTHI